MAKKAEKTENKKLNVTLVKSAAGRLENNSVPSKRWGLKR